MKYDLIIEKQLQRMTSLKRVRIKVDPKLISTAEDFSTCDSYEGYVLEEGATSLKVLLLPPEFSIADIPNELIEYIADEHVQDVFEELVLLFIQELDLQDNDPLLQQLQNCSTLDEIEQFAIERGLNQSRLADIYKKFITS